MSQNSASGGKLPTVTQQAAKCGEKATKPSLHQALLRQRLSKTPFGAQKMPRQGFYTDVQRKGGNTGATAVRTQARICETTQ